MKATGLAFYPIISLFLRPILKLTDFCGKLLLSFSGIELHEQFKFYTTVGKVNYSTTFSQAFLLYNAWHTLQKSS